MRWLQASRSELLFNFQIICNSVAPDSLKDDINSTLAKRSVVIIGRDKMAHDCLARAAAQADVEVPIVITRLTDDGSSRRLEKLCERHFVDVIDAADPNDASVLQRVRAANPVAIFNINGFSILKDELISIPPLGLVNFHNGPLPRYAGLNIPSWVIWNGESEHGVTWHFIDKGIDTGDVIAQSAFGVDERETAMSLTMKCILHGIELFEKVLEEVLSGQSSRHEQTGERTYYRGADIPNDGFIDFDWPAARVDRLLRALDFHPFPNPLVDPRIRLGDSHISVRGAVMLHEPGAAARELPGTITDVGEEGITFLIGDGRLITKSFVGPGGETMSVAQAVDRYGLSRGMRLG